MKVIFLLTGFFLISNVLVTRAQTIEGWIENNEKVPLEKIYLHLDAEHYFQNDTIWFKVYLMDSRSGNLLPGAENIYVNLIDKTGKSAVKSILLSKKGEAFGHFVLPQTVKPDSYKLQAYTDYLLNFSDDVWFQKIITVSRATSSGSTYFKKGSADLVADVSFFPQGGLLLESITNLVAFKAINKAGYGVAAKGKVKDEKGNTVVSFQTDFKGMGLFFITPEAGKSYHVSVDGFPSFTTVLKALAEKVKIQMVNHTSKELILNIAGNSDVFLKKTFYMVNMHRGEVLFYQPFEMLGINQVLKYDSRILKAGINKLVLLTDDLKPISECLVFSRNTDVNQLEIEVDKAQYNKLAKVQLTIKDDKNSWSDEFSNISVSVINQSAFGDHGKSQNILTYLLLDSELKYFYESSADFFKNNEISSAAKLKLLMLTNGWSNYIWNEIPANAKELKLKQTVGIDLKGTVVFSLSNKPLQKGNITLVIQKDEEVAFLTSTTDKQGRFVFPGLMFSDTAKIHLQAQNKNRNQKAEISIESPFIDAISSKQNLAVINQNLRVPAELGKIKYKDKLKNRTVKRNKKSEEEVTKEEDGHFRLYDEADFVVEIPENEESFDNVIDYMAGKVPGLDIYGDIVKIRGSSGLSKSSLPLFLMDGVPILSTVDFKMPGNISPLTNDEGEGVESDERLIQMVKSIPISDVDKVEILKSPQNLATFGARGANGVIAIYTRAANDAPGEKTAKGIIKNQITGYSSYREFYSPKYTPENSELSEKDYRTTLYWNPKLVTREGRAKVDFYTSNSAGMHIVIIEGISNYGKVCLGEKIFHVLE